MLEILRLNYRTNINASCGLHVHVGNGVEGLPVDAIRNLTAYLWTFEPQLNQIHPRIRHDNAYCRSLMKSTYLGKRQHPQVTRKEGLETIIETTTLDEIKRFMCPDSQLNRPAYNLENLFPPFEEEVKRTIEFRQHEGTLEPECIEHWLRVCIGLVRYACDVRRKWNEEFCLKNVVLPLEKCTLLDVLTSCNQSAGAVYYYGRLISGEVEPKVREGELYRINGSAHMEWEAL